MKMKKIIVSSAAICAAITMLANFAFASGLVSIKVNLEPFKWVVSGTTYDTTDSYNNGKKMVPSSVNYEGTTYLPIRLLAEKLGLIIEWDGQSKTANLVKPQSDNAHADGGYIQAGHPIFANIVSPVELRAKPSIDSDALKPLKVGSKVKVLGELEQQWIRVLVDTKIGYITALNSDYVIASDRPAWEQKTDAAITIGMQYLGTPYEFDANTGQTDTFDCSSFLQYIFAVNDFRLPRNSREQSQVGREVKIENIRKGDLLFYTTSARKNNEGVNRIGHVALYLGDNKVLHTFREGIGVTITELDNSWNQRFITARRIID